MRISWARVVIIATLFHALPAFTDAATYYVATTGSDGNTCTQAQNTATRKQTIAAGIACLTQGAGDTLLIGNGTYAEANLTGIPSGGGSYATATQVRAEHARQVIIRPAAGFVAMGFYPTDTSTKAWIIIEGIVFDGTDNQSDPRRAVEMGRIPEAALNTPNHIRLRNIEIRNFDQHGLAWFDGDSLELLDSDIHDIRTLNYASGTTGIYWNAANCIVRNSNFWNITADLNGATAMSIFTSGGAVPDNALVDRVTIHDIGNATIAGIGINFANPGRTPTITNTLIYRVVNGAGIEASVGTISDARFDNLTITAVGGDAINIGAGSNNSVRNTIHFNNGGGILGATTTSNNLSTNPLFVNAAADNYHLQAGSEAVDAGMTLSHITTDRDAVARQQGAAYDIGAYERDTTPPAAPTGLVVE